MRFLNGREVVVALQIPKLMFCPTRNNVKDRIGYKLSMYQGGKTLKSRIIVVLATSVFLIVGSASIGIAQEGGFTSFISSVARTFENIVTPSAQVQAPQDEEESEAHESNESVQEIEPPVTYDNGFTEGDVVESSGVPTYSSEEFVPDGPGAPKEGEINPCVKEASIEQCELEIFNESWQREKPEGANWEEVHFDDVFLGYPVPPMWVNSDTKQTVVPQQTLYYLKYNVHKHATSISRQNSFSVFYSEQWGSDIVRFIPMFQVKGTSHLEIANEEMFPMEAEAFFTSEITGETQKISDASVEIIEYPPNAYYGWERDFVLGDLRHLTPCDKGTITFKVKTPYNGVTHEIAPIDYSVPASGDNRCDKPSASAEIAFGWVFDYDSNSNRYIESFYTHWGLATVGGVDPEGLERSFISFSSGQESWWIENPVVEDLGGPLMGISLIFPDTTINKTIPPGDYEVQLWLRNAETVIDVWDLGVANVVMDTNSGRVSYGIDY